MNSRCKHTFRPGCDNLEGRLSLSSLPPQVPPGGAIMWKLEFVPISDRVHSAELKGDFLPQTGTLPGFAHEASIVTLEANSPLRTVAVANGGVISLNTGDRLLSLDGIPVNPDLSNLENHAGLTTIKFAQGGSDTVQDGVIIIQS